ncbi:hypothetical protein B9G55_03070 [Saccharibacillus sp. O16]|nr:hypothetical protein B9G55_03070 [Saccharibacillus sp. O16]
MHHGIIVPFCEKAIGSRKEERSSSLLAVSLRLDAGSSVKGLLFKGFILMIYLISNDFDTRIYLCASRNELGACSFRGSLD